MVRVGLPASFGRFSAAAKEVGAAVLISANAFWRGNRFWIPSMAIFNGTDVALDSAGFVAMARYWHYPWPLDAYVRFAAAVAPTWWAAPDYCCEPEIASNRSEVLDRVCRTAFKLDWANQVADDVGIARPMPVLQGWLPDDYLRCRDMMVELPSLVGVGSVCRRALTGNAGVLAIVSALDANLPASVKLHLFGVKGQAIGALAGHPRIHSVDSAAWDAAARREWRRDGEQSYHVAYRSTHLQRWYKAQRGELGLFGGLAG